MPVTVTLAVAAAGGPDPLGSHLAAVSSGSETAPDLLAVPVPGPASAGLDAWLGAPGQDLITRCGASSQAGDTIEVLAAGGGAQPGPGRVIFLGVGDPAVSAVRET